MSIFFVNTQDAQISNAFLATLGAAPGSTYLAQVKTFGLVPSVQAMINATGSSTAAALSTKVATNLGLTGSALTGGTAYLSSVTFAGSSSAWAANLMETLNLFSTLQSDATYGSAATAYLARVNSAVSYSSVAANNSTDLSTLAAAVGSAGSTGSGSTFTLTTSIDNVPTASKIINGLIDQTTLANSTWNLPDSVSTTSDSVFNLSLLNGNNATSAGNNTSGVKTLNIKPIDQGNDAKTSAFDVAGMTGLTKVVVANASVIGAEVDTLIVNSLVAGTTLGVNANGKSLNVTANYASAATEGAADTVAVEISGRSGVVTIGTGFETAAITTSGDAARVTSFVGSTLKTVNITGTGVRVDNTLDSTVTSIDASTATGNSNLSVALAATLTAKGGLGKADVLAVNGLNNNTTVSGFETVVASGAATYDLTKVSDAENLGVAVGAGAVSFTNAAATQNTLVFSGGLQRTTDVKATGNLTSGGTVGYALKTATGTADKLTIKVDNGGTASTGTYTIGGLLTATAVEQIELNMTNWKAVAMGGVTQTGSDKAALSFTATGASDLTLGTLTLTDAGTVASEHLVNFGGMTGKTSTGIVNTNNLTYTGGTGADTLTVTGLTADTKAQTYNMGAGNDVVTMGAPAGGGTSTTTFNGGAGDDIFNYSAAAALGTGTAKVVINGGDDTDTLIAIGAADATDGTATLTATISGIEKINFQTTGDNNTTLALTVAAGYKDTVVITDVSASTTAANKITVASTGSVDLSGFSRLGLAAVLEVTGSGTIKGSSTFATTLTGGVSADVFTGGSGVDTYNIAQANSNSTAGIDQITNFVGGTDVLNLAAAGAGTVNTGTTNADVSNNSADVASTGATVTTLLANLNTAADALGANLFDQAGDTFSVKITGASFSGTDVIYVVQNDGANTAVTAADTIIALVGTSTGAISVATII